MNSQELVIIWLDFSIESAGNAQFDETEKEGNSANKKGK